MSHGVAGDFVTIERLAEELGVDARTVRRWVADEGLPCRRVAPRIRVVRRIEFAQWVEARARRVRGTSPTAARDRRGKFVKEPSPAAALAGKESAR